MAYEEGIIFNAIWFWIIRGSHLFCLAKVEVENTTNISNTYDIAQDMCIVVGMTSGVCQGQRCLPAGVPGVSTASSKEDRL
jgi:hypothetical protein